MLKVQFFCGWERDLVSSYERTLYTEGLPVKTRYNGQMPCRCYLLGKEWCLLVFISMCALRAYFMTPPPCQCFTR